jgi:hypothetical protein
MLSETDTVTLGEAGSTGRSQAWSPVHAALQSLRRARRVGVCLSTHTFGHQQAWLCKMVAIGAPLLAGTCERLPSRPSVTMCKQHREAGRAGAGAIAGAARRGASVVERRPSQRWERT